MRYPSIPNVFKRDIEQPGHPVIYGEWSSPEIEFLSHRVPWRVTEKVDGMNIRIVIEEGEYPEIPEVHIRGRSDAAQVPGDLRSHMIDTLATAKAVAGIAAALKKSGGITLYGEGYGAGIQRAGVEYGPKKQFILFDARVGNTWLEPSAVEEIGESIGLPTVPVKDVHYITDAIYLVRENLFSELGGQPLAEGVVATPVVPLCNRRGERVICKIKHRDFGMSMPDERP